MPVYLNKARNPCQDIYYEYSIDEQGHRNRRWALVGREGGKQKEEEKKSRNELDTSGVGHMPVIHTLGRLRQEDFKFEASLG